LPPNKPLAADARPSRQQARRALSWTGHLQRAWLRRGLLACLLWPLSCLYGALWTLRRSAYQRGWLPRQRLPVPVIVVGNVVVGGAGKTPTVVGLVRHLQARGWQPGVLSRGHGRREDGNLPVHADSDPAQVGDEPLLLAQATGVPVWVGRDRPAAGQALLQAHPSVNLLISDDGMQHLALERDLTLVLFDARGCGNGWLLPAGPLRQPWPDATRQDGHQLELHTARLRRLAEHAWTCDGDNHALKDWADSSQAVGALAGIAQPEAFFTMLRQRGLHLQDTLPLPDHASAELMCRALADADPRLPWLCTEKDAVKLLRPGVTLPAGLRLWAVPLEQSLPAEVLQAVDQVLDGLSSGHGRQTA